MARQPPEVAALLQRSNRLGADPRNTNYAGGNTSAKGKADRPGHRPAGRAAVGQGLRRRPGHADRGRAGRAAAGPAARAARRLPGRRARGRDGGRVRLLPARPGRRGAVHRHRHARPGRRCRTSTTCTPTPASRSPTAADGEALTRACFGDRVGWLPWRRPGFQLGLDIAEVQRANPAAIGVILGGHGITAWGATSEECEANSLEIIARRAAVPGRARRAGSVRPGAPRLRAAARGRAARAGRRAGPGHPRPGLHRPAPGRALHRRARRCWTSWPGRGTPRWPRSAPPARTTSCAPRSRRWCSTCRRRPRWTR